jgi:hypothetical protein
LIQWFTWWQCRQNIHNTGVASKIFFLNGLWVKSETPALAGAFS